MSKGRRQFKRGAGLVERNYRRSHSCLPYSIICRALELHSSLAFLVHMLDSDAALRSERQAQLSSENMGEKEMSILKTLIVSMGLLWVLCALPATAQIAKRITFDAPSAFYAGNAKMPAGSYSVSQADVDGNLLLIEDADGSHSAFVEYEVVSSETPHAQSDVTFNKYGKLDFLSSIWIQGRRSEMQIVPSKYEQSTARAAAAEKHSLSAQSAGPQ